MQDNHWQELTVTECQKLLGEQQIGRVALVDRGGPVIFPITYVFHDDEIVFRTEEGSKLATAASHDRVAFEVDGIDEATRTGWSVMARGKAAHVEEISALERLRALELVPWAPGDKRDYVRILPTAITGRRIAMAEVHAANWLG